LDDAGWIGCLTCNIGYNGLVIDNVNSSNNKISYIKSCESNIECSGNVYYNLHHNYLPYISCYYCTNFSKIPFIALKTSITNGILSFTGIKGYSLTTNDFTNYIVGME
jgi:hypothetical protein